LMYHFNKFNDIETIREMYRKIFDVTLGRSEKSLNAYFSCLRNKERTKVVVMDLSGSYKALVRKHFPTALISADRFHVIRLLIHRFLECWKILDPEGRQNRGLLSLFRRKPSNLSIFQELNLRRYLRSKPGLEALYDFKNEIYTLLMQRGVQKKQMREIIEKYFEIIKLLKNSGFYPLISLAKTFESWQEEILRMLRFSRSNACTEGFHNKMEKISRVAYGFRNFKNYRSMITAHLPLGQFENYLKDRHAEEYNGIDDDMPDAFDEWVVELNTDDWIKYGNEYAEATHEN